jgi:DNA topoisomerase VI subunit B
MSKAAKGGSDKLQQKSPAEFFAENKNIAGFDNVRHSHRLSLVYQYF